MVYVIQIASRIRTELHASCQQTCMYCCVYSEKTADDGQRNCPKHVEFYSKNKFEKLVHLVGFVIRIEGHFLGAFAQVRKPTIVFIMSICTSDCTFFRSHWTDNQEIWTFGNFQRNYVQKIKVGLNCHKITGGLHEELCTFLIISR